jgi:hypothetical protein
MDIYPYPFLFFLLALGKRNILESLGNTDKYSVRLKVK